MLFFFCVPFATQLFSTPVTSSNLRNQAPLFTELRFLQASQTSNIRPAYNFHLAGKKLTIKWHELPLTVMSAAHTDKIVLISCEYKNHIKENTTTIIDDILNHSQGNFVIEIKQISWSCSDPIFLKKECPNPILIRKDRKYPSGYLILILPMLTSAKCTLATRDEHGSGLKPILAGSDCIFFKLADQDWIRLRKFLLF